MMTTNLTAETITDDQIAQLRREAAAAGDMTLVVICDLASGSLDGDRADYDGHVNNIRVAVDYYPSLSKHDLATLRAIGFGSWSRSVAQQKCADAVNNARAQEAV